MPNPTLVSLLSLRNDVRQRADLVNSQFVTDPELNTYINASYAELYDLLVQKYGDNYFVATPFNITTDGINDQYALPLDFYKLLGVDLQIAGGNNAVVTLPQFEFRDRNKYLLPNLQAYYGRSNLRYRLNGNNLWLRPLPSAGQVITMLYVPKITYLVNDVDTLDGVSGWEEYIVVDTCIKCFIKQEFDPSGFMSQKQGLIARIEAASENRNAGAPPKVVDSAGSDLCLGPGFGSDTGWY